MEEKIVAEYHSNSLLLMKLYKNLNIIKLLLSTNRIYKFPFLVMMKNHTLDWKNTLLTESVSFVVILHNEGAFHIRKFRLRLRLRFRNNELFFNCILKLLLNFLHIHCSVNLKKHTNISVQKDNLFF